MWVEGTIQSITVIIKKKFVRNRECWGMMAILRTGWTEMMTYVQTGKEQGECALWISGRRTIHQREQFIQRHRGKK